MEGRAVTNGRIGCRIDRDVRYSKAKFHLQLRISLIGEKFERGLGRNAEGHENNKNKLPDNPLHVGWSGYAALRHILYRRGENTSKSAVNIGELHPVLDGVAEFLLDRLFPIGIEDFRAVVLGRIKTVDGRAFFRRYFREINVDVQGRQRPRNIV
jgi:hypothetical protein